MVSKRDFVLRGSCFCEKYRYDGSGGKEGYVCTIQG